MKAEITTTELIITLEGTSDEVARAIAAIMGTGECHCHEPKIKWPPSFWPDPVPMSQGTWITCSGSGTQSKPDGQLDVTVASTERGAAGSHTLHTCS